MEDGPIKVENEYTHKIVLIGAPSDHIATLIQQGQKSYQDDKTKPLITEIVSGIYEVEYKRFLFTFHYTYFSIAPDIWNEDSEIKAEFYRDVAGAILVWDYENIESAKGLNGWMKELRHFTSQSLPVILLGIKSETDYISAQMVRETAVNLKLELFEISIVNSTLFDKLSDIFIQKIVASHPSAADEYLLKICAIGSVPELKNQFVRCFAENKFDVNYLSTHGVDISTKKIILDNTQVKLILVDTAGQAFFGKLRPSYYRGASAAVILFDKSDRKSFDTIPNWLLEFQKYIQPPVPVALVGLITSPEENSEEVSFEEGTKLATDLNLTYFESEPTDRQQASDIFSHLARQVIGGRV